ncbi:hypothetical protein VPH35_138294 [Triticum aestivum]
MGKVRSSFLSPSSFPACCASEHGSPFFLDEQGLVRVCCQGPFLLRIGRPSSFSYISSKYSFEWKDVELTRTAGDGGEEDTINGAVRTIHSSMRLARGDHWTAHGRRVPKSFTHETPMIDGAGPNQT